MTTDLFLTNGTDLVAKTFLFFSQANTIIALLCIAFFGYDKNKISRTLLILFFSMIVNAFLKSIWQIPSYTGKSYAFPSGHMQSSAVLWGWLSLEINKKPFFVFSAFLLCGIAFGLIHMGYHSIIDILGALFFTLILLMIYPIFLKLPLIKKQLATGGFILSLLALPMIYFTIQRSSPSAPFIAEGALIGFSLGMLHKNVLISLNRPAQKIKSILLAIAGIIFIQIGFKYFPIPSKELSLLGCYFLIALWFSAGVTHCIK
jgi:undecaprenyl-diphosphatase